MNSHRLFRKSKKIQGRGLVENKAKVDDAKAKLNAIFSLEKKVMNGKGLKKFNKTSL